jgi:hypothetical protein
MADTEDFRDLQFPLPPSFLELPSRKKLTASIRHRQENGRMDNRSHQAPERFIDTLQLSDGKSSGYQRSAPSRGDVALIAKVRGFWLG